MTKRQRAALKMAMEALRRELRDLPYPPTGYDLEKYKEYAAALQAIEEMLRGEQGVMDI